MNTIKFSFKSGTRKMIACGLMGIFGTLFVGSVCAQDYPTKPVRLVVPYPAGGATDFFARTVFGKVGDLLGQSMIIENRPGAGTTIGSEVVAKSAADGYTLLMGDMGTFALNSSLYKNLRYDPQKSFSPISLTGRFALVLVVNPDVTPVKSMKEFVAYAKQNPGKINYAAPGPGSPLHVAMDLYKQQAGINIVPIPYKGGADAIKDLLGGQVSAMFLDIATALPQLKGGRIRALAISSDKRVASLPDLPTVSEEGLQGFEAWAWQGFVAPAGTPKDVISKLNSAFATAMKDPAIKQKLLEAAVDPLTGTPEQFTAYQSSEVIKWAQVIKASNISLD